jgi:DNA-binding response OmpR family regulator
MIRSGLKGALYSIGFRSIFETSSFIKLHDLIEQDAIDLLVTSSELESNEVGFLVSEMRNQRLGTNPFMVVITLLASAEPDYVKRVIDSGADDLLLTPVAADQLILRIEKLLRARKPFVVTHDYTGPDRRTKARAFDTHSAPMLEVPNPLRIRAESSSLDGTKLNRMVAESATTLNRMKIERYAVQVDWLITHIHASIRDGMNNDPAILAPYVSKLALVAEDTIRRMRGTPLEPHSRLANDILTIARQLEHDITAVPFAMLEQVNNLSRNLSKALGTTPATRAVCAPCAPAIPPAQELPPDQKAALIA